MTNVPVPVPETKTGMQVWELGTELALRQIFLREPVRAFWEATAAELRAGRHVVAIGSPGVGKTSTHPYLLRLLMQMRRPVVFLVRGKDCRGTYYEFRPKDEGGYEAFEYHEKDVKMGTIPALTDSNAFFIIEPAGQLSPPHYWIKARLALVCAPESAYYKGMEKTGTFEFGAIKRYFPLWSLVELLEARPYMLDKSGKPILDSDADVVERFQRFGGIARHVFTEDLMAYKNRQAGALLHVSEHHMRMIMDAAGANVVIEVDGTGKSSPSSYVIACESKPPFSSATTVVVSEYVRSELSRLRSTRKAWRRSSRATRSPL
jgi:hypothetical protein